MGLTVQGNTHYFIAVAPFEPTKAINFRLAVAARATPPPAPSGPPQGPQGTWLNPTIIRSLPFTSDTISVSLCRGAPG